MYEKCTWEKSTYIEWGIEVFKATLDRNEVAWKNVLEAKYKLLKEQNWLSVSGLELIMV